MGDIDHRGPGAFVKIGKDALHRGPQRHIKVGQGFIQQHSAGIRDQTARQGHPLPLSARKVRGHAIGVGLKPRGGERRIGLSGNLGLGEPADLKRVGHVAPHRHMRPERVGLKHKADIALFGGQIHPCLSIGHFAGADADLAAAGGLEPRQDAQKGGFATARRPQKRDKFAIVEPGCDVL